MVTLTEQVQDIELDTVLSVVTWVFNRVTAYIVICNEHKAFWIPTAFAIAGITVSLFKSAMGINNKNNNY